MVRSAEDAAAFVCATGRPALMKPLTGSGSELIFRCPDAGEARRVFDQIHDRLTAHSDARMYTPYLENGVTLDPRRVFVMETLITGQEYSADFILEDGSARFLRLSRKLVRPEPVGTALAYEVDARLPADLSRERLLDTLVSGARTLGIGRAIIMVDFIISDGVPTLIEMTPRPGGDCLPPLVLRSCGFDVLGAALEFAAGRRVEAPPSSAWTRMIGLRLLAPSAGVIAYVDIHRLTSDRRVRDVALRRGSGHRVALPPDDYDSRILGHVIFAPALPRDALAEECEQVGALFEIGYTP
jgi:biotin carboxylase